MFRSRLYSVQNHLSTYSRPMQHVSSRLLQRYRTSTILTTIQSKKIYDSLLTTQRNCRSVSTEAQFGELDISPSMGDDDTTINAMDDYGYQVNGIFMRGSIICLPRMTLLWNAHQITDVTTESLKVVTLIKPRIDVLLIGTGDEFLSINPMLYGYFARRGISVENMSSANAMSTFNVLNQEGRHVAAALLCRNPLPPDETSCYLSGNPEMVPKN